MQDNGKMFVANDKVSSRIKKVVSVADGVGMFWFNVSSMQNLQIDTEMSFCIFCRLRMRYFHRRIGTIGNMEVIIRISLWNNGISKCVHL